MSGDPQGYRPRSPDLSAYSPQPPRLNYTQPPPFQSHQHRGSYDASPYFSPQSATPSQSYFNTQPSHPPQHLTYNQSYFGGPLPGFQAQAPPPPQNFQHPPYNQDPTMARTAKVEDMEDYHPENSATRSKKGLNKRAFPPNGGPSHGIEVKTKFPVARIKRIMQADEDVGKVAQATPTAVSKALELFMITLVTKAAAEAKEKSSKRITAVHLKSAVAKDDVLDFLNEIIEKVPDTEGKGRGRARSSSPDEIEEGKKKRGPRRKKSEVDD